jgi:hypothetical protein
MQIVAPEAALPDCSAPYLATGPHAVGLLRDSLISPKGR